MATVSISGKNRRGKIVLYLAINHKRNKRKLLSLGVSVPPSHWNAKAGEVRKSHQSSASINRRLSHALSTAREVIDDIERANRLLDVETITAAIRSRLDGAGDSKPSDNDFLAFCAARLKDYEGRGQIPTFNAYRTAVNKLRDFTGKHYSSKVLPFGNVTREFIEAFHTYMVQDLGNATNTVHKNLTSIRTMTYHAIRMGHIARNDDPFFKMRIKKEATMRDRITGDEFLAIEQVELKDVGAQETRREFLFAYYAGGMRYSDVCLFKWLHVQWDGRQLRSRFKMKKVSEGAGVVLVPKAIKILEHYDDPVQRAGDDDYVFKPMRSRRVVDTPRGRHNAISSATAVANKNLKKIAKAAGITTKLTTHMARHSIAKLLDEQGWPIQDIMKILGHTQVTTTQNYLRGFQSTQLDEDYKGLFGS